MNIRKHIYIIMLGCFFVGALAGWMLTRGGEEHPEGEHTHVAADGTVYTCSMHPQIRQNEPGQCPLCGMALTPVKQASGEVNPFVLEMTPEAVALSNVVTTKVSSGQAAGKLQMTGKIQVDEQRVKRIAANYSGRIDELAVNFTGQEISKGQKVASIYSPELVTAQKELLEAVKLKERQPLLYEAAKEKLRLWKITEQQIRNIEATGSVQTHVDVFADAAGIVTSRNVAVGDFVSRGSILFDIVDLSQVWVILDAYESDLSFFRKGDAVSFQASAYPGMDFTGKITYIDPVLNPATRTVGVRAEATNSGGRLKPEMFVSATVSTGKSDASVGLQVPKSAVLWTGPRSVVYVMRGNREAPAFEMREIVLGSRSGDNYQIVSGIEEGEQVVSNGVFAIDAAAQLSGNYSMMMPPVSKTLNVPEGFKNQLESVILSYLPIKDALVQTDAKGTRDAVPAFLTAISKVTASELSSKALQLWKEMSPKIKQSSEAIAKENDVEQQRKHFENLSDLLIEAVELYGINSSTFYRQFCPMAFKDTGAYWLSGEKEIRNPYFGDKMLTCGEVKEVYKPGKNVIEGNSGHQGHQH
jgi:membrane fusion protein, copper/silver efflux system